jgi:thymidylate synthase
MISFEVPTFTEAAKVLCTYLSQTGRKVSTPRTGEFLEIRNIVYTVTKPDTQLLSIPVIKQSKLWAYGEVLTEFLSLNPPLTERYTNEETLKFMKTFHRGNGMANYLYGNRWQNDQVFRRLIERLKQDRYSRQAVFTTWDSALDLAPDESNVPCTNLHQIIIRQIDGVDYLNLNVYIRSNDYLRGWKYDYFLNSFILEAFAGFMKCKVGDLTFFAGSFHVYQRDYALLDMVRENLSTDTEKHMVIYPFPLLSFEELYEQLWSIKYIEEESFYSGKIDTNKVNILHPYFKEWALAYANHNIRNLKNE